MASTRELPLSTPASDDIAFRQLAEAAWAVRQHARVIGRTKVGCALLADDGRMFLGCNVEHRFRCHDVHAEVNAITNMISAGAQKFSALVIAADRERFTPCGGCMDWIMEFGGPDAAIGFQAKPGGDIVQYTAHDLMPHYPA